MAKGDERGNFNGGAAAYPPTFRHVAVHVDEHVRASAESCLQGWAWGLQKRGLHVLHVVELHVRAIRSEFGGCERHLRDTCYA